MWQCGDISTSRRRLQGALVARSCYPLIPLDLVLLVNRFAPKLQNQSKLDQLKFRTGSRFEYWKTEPIQNRTGPFASLSKTACSNALISRTLGQLRWHPYDRRIHPKLRHNRSSRWYLPTLNLLMNLGSRLLPNGNW